MSGSDSSRSLRAAKRRDEKAIDLDSEIEMARKRQEQQLRAAKAEREFARNQRHADADLEETLEGARHDELRKHFAALSELGVDLTAYLTQARADQVIELRGAGAETAHVHLPSRPVPCMG